MSTRCIFLDIDGPMIPVRAFFLSNQTKPASVFDPCAASMLNKLIDESGAQIVISSTWGMFGKQRCVELLQTNGINPQHLHNDWITPRKMSSTRFHEINWWLDEHPEVTHYVAIDDENLNMEFVPNAVLCDGQEGFSFRNYLECKMYLDIPSVGPEDYASRINYCKRREVWRLGRAGDGAEHIRWNLADEWFPVGK